MTSYWSWGALVLIAAVAIIVVAGAPAAAQPQQKPGPAQPVLPPQPPANSTEQSNLKALTIEPTPPFADPTRRGAVLLPFGAELPSLRGVLAPMTWREDARASTIPVLRAR